MRVYRERYGGVRKQSSERVVPALLGGGHLCLGEFMAGNTHSFGPLGKQGSKVGTRVRELLEALKGSRDIMSEDKTETTTQEVKAPAGEPVMKPRPQSTYTYK